MIKMLFYIFSKERFKLKTAILKSLIFSRWITFSALMKDVCPWSEANKKLSLKVVFGHRFKFILPYFKSDIKT